MPIIEMDLVGVELLATYINLLKILELIISKHKVHAFMQIPSGVRTHTHTSFFLRNQAHASFWLARFLIQKLYLLV